jgi:hypothetical protein
VYGTLHNADDVDFYTIELDSFAGAGSRLVVKFDANYGTVLLRLRNEAQQIIRETTELFQTMVGHRAGKYSLEVSSPTNQRQHYFVDYVMSPRGLPKDNTDGESLDKELPFVIASPASFARTGTIYTPGDSDEFRFSLADWAAHNSYIELVHRQEQGRLHVVLADSAETIALLPQTKTLADGQTTLRYDVSSPGQEITAREWSQVCPDRDLGPLFRYQTQSDVASVRSALMRIHEANGQPDQATELGALSYSFLRLATQRHSRASDFAIDLSRTGNELLKRRCKDGDSPKWVVVTPTGGDVQGNWRMGQECHHPVTAGGKVHARI